MDLPKGFHSQGLNLLNIYIVWKPIQLIGVFDSLLSINPPVEIIFVIFFSLFSLSRAVTILLYFLIETFTLSFWYCMSELII